MRYSTSLLFQVQPISLYNLGCTTYTQAKKYPNGKQNFGGFCLIVPKPLGLD